MTFKLKTLMVADVFNRCIYFVLFVQDRHAKICQKSATKKRKVFDSSRQRAEGTDIPTLKPIKQKVNLMKSNTKM